MKIKTYYTTAKPNFFLGIFNGARELSAFDERERSAFDERERSAFDVKILIDIGIDVDITKKKECWMHSYINLPRVERITVYPGYEFLKVQNESKCLK